MTRKEARDQAEAGVAALLAGGAAEGDPALKAARQALCLTAWPLALKLAKAHAEGSVGWRLALEHANDVATEALCRAALLWDPARGKRFNTYAGRAIDLSLWKAASSAASRARKARMAVVPMGPWAREEAPPGSPPEPECPRSGEGIRLADVRDEAEALLAALHPADRILAMASAAGEVQSALAADAGTTRQRISQRMMRIRARLGWRPEAWREFASSRPTPERRAGA